MRFLNWRLPGLLLAAVHVAGTASWGAEPGAPAGEARVETAAEAAPAELALLKGEWKLALTQFNGRKVISSDDTVWRLTIASDRWVMTRGPDRNAKFKFDPTQTPKQIDRTFRHGDAETEPETTWQGIYKLDGDTLTICHAGDGPRPDDFQTRPGDGRRTLTWKRVKVAAMPPKAEPVKAEPAKLDEK